MYLNKKYKFLFLVFLALGFTRSLAQDTISSADIEQKSYQLYTDKKWPELISFLNKNISKDLDYFYLRMRIGIAYYEQKNYSIAEKHFRKALEFSTGDELATEYLYYCYVYNGRNEDARMLSKTFSKELAKKTGTDTQSQVGFFMIEAGTKITDSASYYDSHRKQYTNFFNPAVYFQVGLNHYIKNRVSLFHAGTLFSQQTFLGSLKQMQYYLKASVPIKTNWLVSSSFHIINIGLTTTIGNQPPNAMHMGPPKPQTTTANSTYFVGAAAVQKIIGKTTMVAGTTISNLYNKTQLIHSGSLFYSVLGNSKLILGCTGYLHTNDSYSTIYGSAAPFIYAQPASNFSLKFSYFMNSGNNIVEENGYLVNNSSDLTLQRFSLLANVTISKKISLYGLYQLEFKKESVQLFDYKYNVIVFGIKIVPQ